MASIQLKDNTGAALYPKTLWNLVSGAPQILQTINTTNPSTANILSEKAVSDAISKLITEDKLAAEIKKITPASIGALAMVSSSGMGRVYGITTKGAQTTRNLTGNAEPSTLMYRESNGDCQIQDPKNAKSVANKQYVDNSITKAMAQVSAGNKPSFTWSGGTGSSEPVEGTVDSSGYYYASVADDHSSININFASSQTGVDAELFLTVSYGRLIYYSGSIGTYCDKTLSEVLDEFNSASESKYQGGNLYLHIIQGSLVAYSYHISDE